MKDTIVFLLSLLLTSTNIHSMESYAQKEQQIQQKALQAKEYNKKNPNITFIDNFIKLPSDISCQIINFQYFNQLLDEINKTRSTVNINIVKVNNVNAIDLARSSNVLNKIELVLGKRAFEQSIKRYMKFRRVCTHFNEVLTPQTIGFLHKHYSLDEKNELWQQLMANSKYNINAKSLPAVILICADATDNTNTNALLHDITANNNIQHAEILFQHGIDANLQYDEVPIFFAATTIDMIKTFMTYGVNIHAEANKWPTLKRWENSKQITDILHVKNQLNNVLWHVLDVKYEPELMWFYLSQGVSPKKLYTNEPLSGAFCILHEFANPPDYTHPWDRYILKKGEFLFNAMPEMVNIEDMYGRTPLDIALASLRKIGQGVKEVDKLMKDMEGCTSPHFPYYFEPFASEFIALFRRYKAKTADELKCFLF